jgi:iron complex outermembrane receptor protein
MLTGGNSALVPQNSKSFSAGAIWQPNEGWYKGLRLNLEYYKIEQFDAIDSLQPQDIVNAESIYPERVIRDGDGNITVVDTSMQNLYLRSTNGIDFNAEYRFATRWGRFSVATVATYIDELGTQFTVDGVLINTAGESLYEGGALKRKANVSIDWQRDGWTAGWNTRYFDSYPAVALDGGPQATLYNNGVSLDPRYRQAQGADRIPSQMYSDMYLSYSFGSTTGGRSRGLLNEITTGLSVQFGVQNVFDKVPPLDVGPSDINFYRSPYGDMRLRSYRLSVKKFF